MKIQLLYQKVYFKSSEWKELISFISTLFSDVSIFLLSKNHVIMSLKQMKLNFLGECLIIEISTSLLTNTNFNDLMLKIENKYGARLFFIGYLFNNNFINKLQMNRYLTYFLFRIQNKMALSNLHNLSLYELFKYFKIQEIKLNIGLFFFKNNCLKTVHSYYY